MIFHKNLLRIKRVLKQHPQRHKLFSIPPNYSPIICYFKDTKHYHPPFILRYNAVVTPFFLRFISIKRAAILPNDNIGCMAAHSIKKRHFVKKPSTFTFWGETPVFIGISEGEGW